MCRVDVHGLTLAFLNTDSRSRRNSMPGQASLRAPANGTNRRCLESHGSERDLGSVRQWFVE